MVHFLIFLGLFSYTPAKAIYAPGLINTITIAGRVFTTTGLIQLVARATSAGNYTTFRLDGGSAGYQVTSGKTLTIVAAQYQVTGTSANGGCSLGYADTDAGLSNGSAPTNPVYMVASATGYFLFNAAISATNTILGNQEAVVNFGMAATKYPLMKGDGTAVCMARLFGYET